MEEGSHWLWYIDVLFTPLIDTETGDFLHFPGPGSYLEQPYRLMEVLLHIQAYYKKARYERAQRLRV